MPDSKPVKQRSLMFAPRIRGKTVYLLGAGFSAGTGVPTLSKFIPEGLDLIKSAAYKDPKNPNSHLVHLVQQVESVLHDYLPAAEFLPDRLTNLEDLFCLVDLRKQYQKDSERQVTPQQQETILKEFVVCVLEESWSRHQMEWEKHAKGESNANPPPVVPHRHWLGQSGSAQLRRDRSYNTCAYQAFLSQVLHDNRYLCAIDEDDSLKYANVIVTLNYDLVIERKLQAIAHSAIYFGELSKERLKWWENDETKGVSAPLVQWKIPKGKVVLPLIKIHGSINWQVADDQDAASPDSVAVLWHPAFHGPSRSTDEISKIPIIPPTWRKTASTNTVFAKLLGEALWHMKLASRIVIVGYSMPTTDSYFRYLLAEALGTPTLPTIEVWDMVEVDEMKRRIQTTLGGRIAAITKVSNARFIGLVQSRSAESAI